MDRIPRRHLAWLIQGAESYGVQQATLSLSSALTRSGWRITFVSLASGAFTDVLTEAGASVVQLRVGPVPGLGGSLLKSGHRLLQLTSVGQRFAGVFSECLRRIHPDAVHIGAANLLFIAAPVVRRLGLPTLWQMHVTLSGSYPFHLNRYLYRLFLRRNRVMPIANSKYTALSLGGRRSDGRRVLYLGVNAARFEAARTQPVRREDLDIPHDAPLFGIVARLTAHKGQEMFVRAVAALEDRRDVHLLLVGGPLESDFAARLRLLAADFGLAPRIHLVGPTTRPEAFYPMIDVAVSSTIGPEPFGLSVIEAMMAGKPVLAHALGGPQETVLDGVTGWHMNDATVESYVSGIRQVLADRGLWSELGANGQRRALSQFSDTAMAEKYGALVEEMLCTAGTARKP